MRRLLLPFAPALCAWLVGALLCAVPSAAWAQDDVRVRAGLAAEEVLLGDGVGMTILVEGVDSAQGPEPEDFGDDFDVTFDGAAPSHRTSVVTVNGETRRTEEVSLRMDYTLRPRRAGELEVPALTVRVEGEAHRIRARSLLVIGPRATDVARLRLGHVPARVYVEQPCELVLEVEIQAAQLGDEWFDGDPWFSGRPPELRVPWFQGLDGFHADDPREFAGSLLAGFGESGFRINGLAQRALLGDARALRFQLPRRQKIENGRAVYVYELRKRLLPLRAGSFPIPVSTLNGDTIQELRRVRGQLQADATEAVFVAHEPVELEVLPIPDRGAPPTYSHAVGRYRVTADVQPRRVNVGDPMTLTLTVNGSGLLDRVAAPRLELQSDLSADFQVAAGDPARTDETGRVFSFTLRPLRPGIERVPPLEFASFEPESEDFVVARSEPLEVTVEAAQSVAPSEVELADGGRAIESSPGDEIEGGLLGNASESEMLADERYDPVGSGLFWALLVLPPLGFVASGLLARRRAAHRADPAARRARTALPRALERLQTARDALDRGSPSDAAAALHGTLAGYVADKARLAEGTLTAADVADTLERRGVASAAAEEIVSALRACEAARFGGTAAELPDRVDAAEGWVRALERERWS